jgi:hypothetical protein
MAKTEVSHIGRRISKPKWLYTECEVAQRAFGAFSVTERSLAQSEFHSDPISGQQYDHWQGPHLSKILRSFSGSPVDPL